MPLYKLKALGIKKKIILIMPKTLKYVFLTERRR